MKLHTRSVDAGSPSSLLVVLFASAVMCAPSLAPSLALAQDARATVGGTVTDEHQRPLAGASLQVLGSSITGSAARDGSFRLLGVQTGSRRIVIRYLGYKPESVTVNVAGGARNNIDVVMRHPAQQLEAIVVESPVAGQAAALNQQKSADNLSSVVDAELVGRLPDRNLAEALGRVPGVALVRDQGEGRFVQIRGTSASLNTLSIDGQRMPSPDPGTRQTPMDVIPSDMVAAIQVNKSLTPDLDGDAIGGNINLITPTPRTGMPLFSLNIAGGQNIINKGALKNFSGLAGRRFGPDNKIGIVVGGSYYQNDRGSQNYEMGWCVETTCKGVTADRGLDAPTQIALRNYSQVLRTRKGGNGTLDYHFTDNHQIYVKGFYSKFSDDEERYVTTPSFSSGTYTLTDANHGTVVGARMDKELRLRPVSQSQGSIQVGAKHQFSNTLVDYSAQIARAREDRPKTLTMAFRQSSMDFTYDVSDEDMPRFTVTKGAEVDASRFTYNSLRQQTRHALDDDKSAKLNISTPVRVGSANVIFKFGGSARLKNRSALDSSNRFLATFKTGAATPTLPLTLAAVQGTPRTKDFLNNDFTFGPQASADLVKNFFNTYGSSLNINAAQSQVESNQTNYDLDENVYAGYAMATVDAGKLRLIGGARVENTSEDNQGFFVRLAGTAVTIVPQKRSQNYSNVLPSITAKYSLTDRSVIRAAATTSLVRPNFSDFAPSTNIPDGTGVVATVGNPDLLPIRAVNLDFMVEHYFGSVGFVSAGVFHKSLKDYIFVAQRAVVAADNMPSTVTSIAQSQNAESGTLNGFEVALQQNLTMLPGVLRGLGINTNYTRTTSSTTLPSREGTKARLPGQAGNAANVGVFYEYSRLSLKAGYNFADKYLEVIGSSPATDIYVASRGQLDASGTFNVMPNAKIFIETNNLTNQPLRRYEGRSERSWQPGNEYYRSWGMAGIRIQR
ncbi:MAG: TonB-dependent receptor [Gemmatimonadaceae bacterium]